MEDTAGSTVLPDAERLGDHSMAVKRRWREVVYRLAPRDPRDRVKALLLEPERPESCVNRRYHNQKRCPASEIGISRSPTSTSHGRGDDQ